jgi:hypothetical protein
VGNGLDDKIKYLHRATVGSAGNGLGVTIK